MSGRFRYYLAASPGMTLVALLLAYTTPAVGQETQASDAEKCVVEFSLPEGATVTANGRDYGTIRRLQYNKLQPGKSYSSSVRLGFSGDRHEEHRLLLESGRRVHLASAGPRDDPPQLLLQTGHSSFLDFVLLHPNGRHILTSGDNRAVLWDLDTGNVLQTYEGHTDKVASAAFSPDGKQILTNAGRTAILWDLTSGRQVRRFRDVNGKVAFSPDGRRLAIGETFWDAASGKSLGTVGGRFNVMALQFSPDSQQILLGGYRSTEGGNRGEAQLWDVATRQLVRTFQGSTQRRVETLAFSADGKRIATGTPAWGRDPGETENNYAAELIIWETSTGRKLRTFPRLSSDPRCLVFTPDGRGLFGQAEEEAVVLWDVENGQELQRFVEEGLQSALVYPDGQKVLVSANEDGVSWWDPATGAKLREFLFQRRGMSTIESLAVSPDGRQVLVGDRNHHLMVWNSVRGERQFVLAGNGECATFSPDGRFILAGGPGDGKKTCLWDAETSEQVRTFAGHTERVKAVAFSPDGRQILTGSIDKTAILWDAQSGEKLRTFSGHEFHCSDVDFLPDGKHVLTTSGKGTELWEIASGQRVRTFREASGTDQTAVVSPNGRVLLTEGNNYSVLLWDVASGRKLQRLSGPRSNLGAAAFRHDGRQVIIGLWDHTAILWDLVTEKKLRVFRGHAGHVDAVAFSPNGDYVLTGSADGVVRLCDVATGRELVRLLGVPGSGRSSREQIGKEWLVVTPEGLFDGSTDGRQRVTFRVGGGLNVVPLDRFFQDFYFPGLLAYVLRGQRPLPEVELGRSLPPKVRIVSPSQGGEVELAELNMEVEVVDQGGGILGPWLMQNTARVVVEKSVQQEGKLRRYRFRVPLVEGENSLEIWAASADGSWESEPACLIVRYTKPLPKPELYVVAVGVSQYADPSYQLRHAATDAQTIAELFRERGPALYKDIHVTTLLDKQATKPAVLSGIRGVAGKARPQDTLIVFLAGHGAMVDPDYYLLLHDFQPSAAGLEDDVRRQGLLASELGKTVADVPALKRIVVFDTGQSGGPQVSAGAARDPFAFRGAIERLSRAQGGFTIATAGALPESRDVPGLDHGLLTYTLLAGLHSAEAGPLKDEGLRPAGGDRMAYVLDWFGFASAHLPLLTRRYYGQAMDVQHSGRGSSFPVLPLPEDGTVRPVGPLPEPETTARVEPATPLGPAVRPQGSADKPRLHLVAVGINRYAEASMNLRLARDDARTVAELFRRRGRQVYSDVLCHEVLDQKATRSGILKTLQQAAADSRPQDVFCVFLAGHGTMVGQRYYFIPHEFRRRADTIDEDVARQGLPGDALADALAKAPAVKRLLILDTCASGGAIRLGRAEHTPFALRGAVEQMGQRGGVFTIAAAAAGAEAQEIEDLGHGVLTYTLLAGLRGLDAGPLANQGIRAQRTDGSVDVLEWFGFASTHVPQLTERFLGRQQDVQTSVQGTSFALLPARGEVLPRSTGTAPAPATGPDKDSCVMQLKVPAGSTVVIDGRDYGNRRDFTFAYLSPDTSAQVHLEVRFPGGGRREQEIRLTPGRVLRLTFAEPSAGPDYVLPVGHQTWATAHAYSPNGRWMLTGSHGGATLWDLADGRILRSFVVPAVGIAFQGNDRIVTAGPKFGVNSMSTGCQITIWNLVTGQQIRRVQIPIGTYGMALSPDGRFVLVTGGPYDERKGEAILWDVEADRQVRTFWGHAEMLKSLRFSPDGRQVLTAASGTALLWNVESGKKIRTFATKSYGLNQSAFSRDGQRLFLGGYGGAAYVFDVASGQQVATLEVGDANVSAAAFSPDGSRLLILAGKSGEQDAEAALWDLATRKKLRSLKARNVHSGAVSFAPGGGHVLVDLPNSSMASSLGLFDVETGQLKREFAGRVLPAAGGRFSADGRQLLLHHSPGTATLWDLAEGRMKRPFTSDSSWVMAGARFGPDGRQILCWGGRQVAPHTGEAILWDAETGKRVRVFGPHKQPLSSATFSPDGRRIIAAGYNARPTIWDAATGKTVRTFSDDDTTLYSGATFSGDGRQVFTAHSNLHIDGTATGYTSMVKVWDAATGAYLRSFGNEKGHAAGATISPDGQLFFLARMQNQGNQRSTDATLWDVATGQKILTLPQRSAGMRATFSPDSRHLAVTAVTPDGPEVRLLDVRTGQVLASFAGLSHHAGFSPDGRLLVIGGMDGTAHLWDTASGQELIRLACLDSGRRWVALAPDGRIDGSDAGMNALSVRTDGGLDLVPVAPYRAKYHRSKLLAEIWNNATGTTVSQSDTEQ